MDGHNMNPHDIETSSTDTNNMDHDLASGSDTNIFNPNMDGINAWPSFIDPQLLESQLLEPTTFGHGAPIFEQQDEGMEDAPYEIEEAAHETQLPHRRSREEVRPTTPQPQLNRQFTLALQTPPQSQPSMLRFNAHAVPFEPGSEWHASMLSPVGNIQDTRRMSVASNAMQEAQGGLMTPTSAASAHRRHPDIYGEESPTPQLLHHQQYPQQLHAGTQQWPFGYNESTIAAGGSAPPSNFHGSQAGIAPVEDLQGWIRDGPYNPENTFQSADRLTPPAPVQHGRQRSPSQGSFACTDDSCPKTFATKAERDHHQRYHGNKDHVCGVCSKGFHFPKDLKRHAKIHNPRERHLLCTILHCRYHTKGFHRQDHLNRHMEKVHGRPSARNSTRNSTPA